MHVKMLSTMKGAEQGVHVKTYKKGEKYEVSDELGEAFIGAKAAEECKSPKKPAAKEKPKQKGK